MRMLIFLEAFLIALCIFTSTPWAEGSQVHLGSHKSLIPHGVNLFPPISGNDGLRNPQGLPIKASLSFNLGESAFSVKTTYVEKKQKLTGLSGARDQRNFMNFAVSSSHFGGSLTSEGELAYSNFNPTTEESLKEDRPRLFRFGLKGNWSRLRYGTEYRSVGKGFVNLKGSKTTVGRERAQVWASHSFGPIYLRTSLTGIWENIGNDPNRPRVMRTATTLLSYGRPTWNAALSSGFTLIKERFNLRRKTVVFSHSIRSSYRPAKTFTVAPRLSLKEIRNQWSGVRTYTPSASLSLNYRHPKDVLSFRCVGSYSRSRSNDRLRNTRTLKATANLIWKMGDESPEDKSLSLKITVDRHFDFVYRNNYRNVFSAEMLFKVVSF